MSEWVVVVGAAAGLTAGFLFGLASVRHKERELSPEPEFGESDAEWRAEPCHLPAPEGASNGEAFIKEAFTGEASTGSMAVETEPSEFDDLLAGLGSEASDETDLERRLARRDDELEELRARLADLVPLGEQLGAANAALIETRAELEDLEQRHARNAVRLNNLQKRWKVMPEDQRKAAKRIADLEERLERFKADKRRLASSERKLQRELESAQERIRGIGARPEQPRSTPASSAAPIDLMRLDGASPPSIVESTPPVV